MADAPFFAELANTHPWAKVLLFGGPGSGKSRTLALLLAGLHKLLGSSLPVVYLDTEEAAANLLPIFQAAGVRVLHRPTRKWRDLAAAMALVREGAAQILVADSITHFWEDMVEECRAAKGRAQLDAAAWGELKAEWRRSVAEPFVRDPAHYLFAGRAGFEYERVEGEDGRAESVKSGVRIQAESGTAYEGSVVVFMERREELLGSAERRVWRQATVVKDRTGLLDGRTFPSPAVAVESGSGPRWEDFAPAFERMLAGATARPALAEVREVPVFRSEGLGSRVERDVLLGEITAVLHEAWPGQTAEAKHGRSEALREIWGARSWEYVAHLEAELLRAGLARLHNRIDNDLTAQSVPRSDAFKPVGARSSREPGRSLGEQLVAEGGDPFGTPTTSPGGAAPVAATSSPGEAVTGPKRKQAKRAAGAGPGASPGVGVVGCPDPSKAAPAASEHMQAVRKRRRGKR